MPWAGSRWTGVPWAGSVPATSGASATLAFGLTLSAISTPPAPPVANQQRYRAVVTDAASHYYGESTYWTVKDITDELNGTGSCTITTPIDDPEAAIFQPVTREVAVFRDGLSAPFWRGPIVRPSTDTTPPAKVSHQCQNPLWYFSHRYFGSPIFPTNYIQNGSMELWDLSGLPDFWLNNSSGHTHITVAQMTTQANPGLVVLGESAVKLTSDGTLNSDTYLRQTIHGTGTTSTQPGYYPLNSEGYLWTLSAWFYIVPTMTAGPYGARGLHIEFIDSIPNAVSFADFTITPSMPSGLWIPASVQLEMPGYGTQAPYGPWDIDVRLYLGVGGSIIWDAVQLTVPESLSPAQPGGSDQSIIMSNIVRLAQGQAASGGGVGFPVDNTKSNLHISTSCPATGFLRADLVYLMSDRRGILDALNDFPGFYPENDFAVVDLSPTSRQFQTFGRAVTDGVTTSGLNTFSSASAAFTTADCYQPLWTLNIPGGALILPASLTSTSVTFSGPPANASGSSQAVFIGGRRGSYKPDVPIFMDATSANVVSVSTWDQDGEQMANSVVATGTATGTGAYVGAALNGVNIGGTLSAARNASSTYTTLAVTATTVAIAAGDILRVGATQWQPGVGNEGEAVIASASAAIGATSISIISHTFSFTWPIGAVVGDFTPVVTMEDVITATSPAPIGSLTQQAQAEMLVRQDAVEILNVTTVNDFIHLWCADVPLVCGDVLNVTLSWGGYLNIVNVPYRVISWTLNPDTDAYQLQMNVVAL